MAIEDEQWNEEQAEAATRTAEELGHLFVGCECRKGLPLLEAGLRHVCSRCS
jgi:hypothetical protein